MKIYKGINALSDFRAKNLLKELQAIDKNIQAITAEFVHFVDVIGEPNPESEAKLKKLLTYDSQYTGDRKGELFLVTPRFGTISPWSSKATDIAHNVGLKEFKRLERGTAYYIVSSQPLDHLKIAPVLIDRMTETVLESFDQAEQLFDEPAPRPLVVIDVLKGGKTELEKANVEAGLALSQDEIEYLAEAYKDLGRNPTDAELMMFGQVNSEHCRHKIFNADWVVDGQQQPKSLFKMIRNTYEKGGEDVLSAYSDNSAVLKGPSAGRFLADPKTGEYTYHQEPIHTVIKVETHNHPTAIAPFPGAATGTGGEIRDEGSTGRGAKPKMGLTGFTVSNLNLPSLPQPWEKSYGKPDRITNPLGIMIDAPLGGSSFANEFGRPNLAGYFRTYEQFDGNEMRGYHKPIMIAGGLGNIRDQHVEKGQLQPGDYVIVLGGPAMLIGLGGGAASSMQTGASSADLDFASVQRGNAEMERRCQEVVDTCCANDQDNPIVSIHDIGAGGYSNALPELVHDAGLGAEFELRDLPSAETGLSPLEIWCNEAQERYVLGVKEEDLARFEVICQRERCPYAVVGRTTAEQDLIVRDKLFQQDVVNLPMSVLFGKPPKMIRSFEKTEIERAKFDTQAIEIDEAVKRVLQMPSVGSKKFLITIGDRNVTGLTTRDQMIGKWQVPVSDVAVTATSFDSEKGEAMAMGERTPLAVINAPASGRMAVAETITNMLAANIEKLSDIKLSANWMAAAGHGQEDQALYETVRAVGEEFCPELGLTIPVGKDSLSMRTTWQEDGQDKSIVSPLSLIITGFSPVQNVGCTLTPELDMETDSKLILVDLSGDNQRLGGSALAQAYNQTGNEVPDVKPATMKRFFEAITDLKKQQKILAYHDRSDGGLLTVLAEMAFASRCGLDIDIAKLPGTNLERLFNEELGAVIQVRAEDADEVLGRLKGYAYDIGRPTKKQQLIFRNGEEKIYENSRAELEEWWSQTSYQIQKLRDNPDCADQEFAAIGKDEDPGLSPEFKFQIPNSKFQTRPKVAIFREQGVNGHIEMAAAFDKAGFQAVDVHLNDLLNGTKDLKDFAGLAACGGFSYGDVLGAGEGWAKTILFDEKLRAMFQEFFERQTTFSLGVCNGCQMLSTLKELIPGAEAWPRFLRNTSEQFEARLTLVKVNQSPSILFKDMADSHLLVPVAHGEGRAQFDDESTMQKVLKDNLVPLQYVNNQHNPTEAYPANPNGSPLGITSLTSRDGRATILMPHPERAFQTRQLSWHPKEWNDDSPWLRLFQNARTWLN